MKIAWLPTGLLALGVMAFSDAAAQTGCQTEDLLCATLTSAENDSDTFGFQDLPASVSTALGLSNYGSIGENCLTTCPATKVEERRGNLPDKVTPGRAANTAHWLWGINYTPDTESLTVSWCGISGRIRYSSTFCSDEGSVDGGGGAGGGTVANLPGTTLYINGVGFGWSDATQGTVPQYSTYLTWEDVTNLTLTENSTVTIRVPAANASDPTSTTCANNDLYCSTMTVGKTSAEGFGYVLDDAIGAMSSNQFKIVTTRPP